MKKTLILSVLVLGFHVVALSQDISRTQLFRHIHALTDKSLNGRPAGTTGAGKAASYIRTQLQDAGLNITDFPVSPDSIIKQDYEQTYTKEEFEQYNFINSPYKNFFTIINAGNNKYGNEYIYLTAYYSGQGIDTVQSYPLIKYGANDNASGTAAVIEIAKYLKQNSHLLQRYVIIMFSEYDQTKSIAKYFINHYDKGKFTMAFNLEKLGFIGKDEDENQYLYTVSKNIKNADKILQPLLMKDIQTPADVYYSPYKEMTEITVSGEDLPVYEDTEDSLEGDNMYKIVNQASRVIMAFDTVALDIKENTFNKEEGNGTIDDIISSVLGGKQKSYFGVNAMIGSNKHYYTKGKMTGKAAMSYSAGIFYKYTLSSAWSLKLDANYERAYANRHDGRFENHAISIPFSVINHTGYNDLEFYYGVGVYYDRMLGGKLNGKKLDWDNFNKNEFGWQFSLALRTGHFMIGYYQKIGISDIMTENFPLKGKIKNRNQYFVIGWKL